MLRAEAHGTRPRTTSAWVSPSPPSAIEAVEHLRLLLVDLDDNGALSHRGAILVPGLARRSRLGLVEWPFSVARERIDKPHMSYDRPMTPASSLFEPARLGGLEVRNRFVRAGTSETMADDRGAVTDQYVALYEELARNDVGLIFTGHLYVAPRGRYARRQTGIYADDLVPGLRRVADAVHRHGGRSSRRSPTPAASRASRPATRRWRRPRCPTR